jgi:lipopolysaccharide export LptBFGC system permease protein LptF
MGQQQLLLVVLGIIIVGVAIVVGINVFTASAAEAKRDNIINDLIHLASEAQKYYKTPTAMGGGSQKFTGWKIPFQLKTNADGSFLVSQAIEEQKVILVGTGNEVVTGNDSVKVKITILPSDFSVTIIN